MPGRRAVLNGCPTRRAGFSQRPRRWGTWEEDQETEAGTTRFGRAAREGSRGAQPALRHGAPASFLPPSRAPILGGMLLFKETLLNYFLLIVTFPSLSSPSCSQKGNKPAESQTAGNGGRAGPHGEAHPDPRSPKNTQGSPLALPPSAETKTRLQRPSKLPHHSQCTRSPRPQSPVLVWEARKLPNRGRLVDFRLCRSKADCERAGLPFQACEGQRERGSPGWAHPRSWLLVEPPEAPRDVDRIGRGPCSVERCAFGGVRPTRPWRGRQRAPFSLVVRAGRWRGTVDSGPGRR